MTALRHAVIDANGEPINMIMLDPETPYTPPPGCTVALWEPEHETKWRARDDGRPADEPDPLKDLADRVTALEARTAR